jgi:anti-anti-sigma regulatory factor
MATIAEWRKIDEEHIVQMLQEASEALESAGGEVVLDFSSVRRVDPSAIRAIEKFADMAADKGVKVVLRGVKVDVYKVLKLVRLAPRMSFAS